MSVPSLRFATQQFSLPSGVPAGVQLFTIARDGVFAGRRFRAGELAVVEGTPEDGDSVVLVARGPGRPRLGRVAGTRLLGDQGEPCLLSRWEVAGRVLGVVRPVGSGWSVEMFDQPGLVGMAHAAAASAVAHAPEAVQPVAQLSLFAA